MKNKWLVVTGGAGFIGSNFVHRVLRQGDYGVLNLDKLTYAGNPENLASLRGNDRYRFVQGDIGDRALVSRLLNDIKPWGVVNFAAESHVDRSIDGPRAFVDTNVTGTLELLQAARDYWKALPSADAESFRFLHVSTDEVFGSLGPTGHFREDSPYQPNSPYAASKAAADHFVRAFHHTFGLPTVTTNCSNNYGPYQFPEKLIPLMILNAIEGKPLPIYGDGKNVRDWIYVEDHCDGVLRALEAGRVGDTYNLGSQSEKTNLEIVHTLCALLDERLPPARNEALRRNGKSIASYKDLMTFVPDRPGHDRRYAIDPRKSLEVLGFQAAHSFAEGMRKTVDWYLDNRSWCEAITSGVYQRGRLGLGPQASVAGQEAP